MRKASTFRFAIALLATVAPAGVAFAASPNILISEFRTRGPAGGSDKFVEIWNNSASVLDISGYTLRGSNNAGTTSQRAVVPPGTLLGAGCHHLFTNSTATGGYSGVVPGNTTFNVGITDDGGIAILTAAAVIVDQAGMSPGSLYKEGAVLTPRTTNIEQSYEWKPGGGSGNSLDTDNNASDFLYNSGSSNPQNAASSCLGATPTRTQTWGQVKTIYR